MSGRKHSSLEPSIKRGKLITIAALIFFLVYISTKLSWNRSFLYYDAEDDFDYSGYSESDASSLIADRSNCQIIYILGVEGSIHHGFTPIIEKLAAQQLDPSTDTSYEVSYPNGHLRRGIFGHHGEIRPLDDPSLISRTLRYICPADGKKHVVLEDASFPCGYKDDIRTYRIHRMPWWSESTMEEIAMSDTALNHPTNLGVFYKLYSPYADIKFVVIHRSYVETIASHIEFDGTVSKHSSVIRGFLLLLRRFLDSHPIDEYTGRRLWTLVCAEQLSAKAHEGSEEQMNFARQNILSYLADFLGWSNKECPECFSHWRTSSKDHLQKLGKDGISILLEHMKKMGGIWPPVVEDALPEQKCTL